MVRLMWVHSAHECGQIHNAMTTLTGTIELGKSWMKRDYDDLQKNTELVRLVRAI